VKHWKDTLDFFQDVTCTYVCVFVYVYMYMYIYIYIKVKMYSSPVTGLEWPRGFQEIKVP